MTEPEIFNRLFSGGRFSLPYLIKFTHPTAGTIRLVNNNQSVELEGEQYEVSTFLYTEPNNKGEAGTLEITAVDNTLIEFVENADYRFRLDVVGVLIEDGTIQKIKTYSHFFGSVSYGLDMKLSFQLGKDDRLDMAFPPYVFDADNNRGNA